MPFEHLHGPIDRLGQLELSHQQMKDTQAAVGQHARALGQLVVDG